MGVKGELALWRITVVVREEPPLEISHCAKIHCEALLRSSNFFGFVDIRVYRAGTWSCRRVCLRIAIFSCRHVSKFCHISFGQWFFIFSTVLSQVLTPSSAKEVDISGGSFHICSGASVNHPFRSPFWRTSGCFSKKSELT